MNLTGSIDLLKLDMAGVATIRGKKCVVVPIEENDLYISVDENLKAKSAYLGLSVFERKEVSLYGKTHFVKQSFSKEFRESTAKDVLDAKPFLGDMKTFVIENKNGAASVEAPATTTEQDDLPF